MVEAREVLLGGYRGLFFMEIGPSKELYGPNEVAVSLPGYSHRLSTLLGRSVALRQALRPCVSGVWYPRGACTVRFGVGAPQLSDLWGDFGVLLDVASPQRLRK